LGQGIKGKHLVKMKWYYQKTSNKRKVLGYSPPKIFSPKVINVVFGQLWKNSVPKLAKK
jgi:hypothetical protein